MADILFFCIRANACKDAESGLCGDFKGAAEVWAPTLFEFKPQGLGYFPYAVWWVFNYIKIFRNNKYKICLLRQNGQIVHRTCVFPPFFKFPFMDSDDIQLGDIWTAVPQRGTGISKMMLQHIIAAHPNNRIWLLCESENLASANLARSVGMELYGTGLREPLLGIAPLGRFVIRSGPRLPSASREGPRIQ